MEWHYKRGSNDEDLGEVQEVTDGYVLVQRGLINKEKFYIPKDQAESYGGSVLTFRVTEGEIINKYKRDSALSSSSQERSSSTLDSNSSRIKQQQQQEGRESEETKVPLTAEKLDVSKNTKQSQASITKEPNKRN